MAITPLILARSDIEQVIPPLSEVVELVAEVYRESATGKADVPTKIGIHPDWPLSFLHAMPAWLAGRRELGMKWVSYYPGSGATPDSDATAIMVLNDPDTGVPVAILEGMHFTNARTAASGVFAAACLAPETPETIGLIGCGGLQKWILPELIRRYPTIVKVNVTSKRRESRTDFAKVHAVAGIEIAPADSVEEAITGADIVVSAIPQGNPAVANGAWLKQGALVIAFDILGTWDDDALARFGLLATDGLPRLENIIATERQGATLPPTIVSFEELASNEARPRCGQSPMLAIPTGVASLDVALGWEIYRRALAADCGRQVTLL